MHKIISKILNHIITFDVFISVAEDDLPYAHKIKVYLEKWGATVFLFPDSITVGRTWREDIKSNLDNCHFHIAIISKNSNKSKNVYLELGGAYFKGKNILLIMIDINEKIGMVDELQYVSSWDEEKIFNILKKKLRNIYFKWFLIWIFIILAFFNMKHKWILL